ncbi:hypothetical protein R3P38DRAFT_3211785 [Favolaschia claudopus]|uniref:Uncharacterized protein n=1 Tax=Favolaschia claudopus TaxID=2862362 RepID=A0AAW0AGC0_9AGAR
MPPGVSMALMIDDAANTQMMAAESQLSNLAMTRDRTALLSSTRVDCFSCKNVSRSDERRLIRDMFFDAHDNHYRKPGPASYMGWVFGQVHNIKACFDHRLHPHLYSMDGQLINCYVISLKSADQANEKTKEDFDRQVEVLTKLMHCDRPWCCIDDAENDCWLGTEVNGSKTIKVTLTEDQMMLWNGGDWAFPPNQNIRVAVSLERYDGFQSYIHTYTAWMELFQVVNDWDLN